MTTPYIDRDGWADREAGLTWAEYVSAGYTEPSADFLDTALEKATRIINRRIGFRTTNISDSSYLGWIQDLTHEVANRYMAVQRNKGFEGAMFRFSPQDYLYIDERDELRRIGKIKLNRRVGRVVF